MTHEDASRTIDALLAASGAEAGRNPSLARRYRLIADSFGDALETLPDPSDVRRRGGERLRNLGV